MNYELVKSANQASIRLAGFINEDSDLVFKKIAKDLEDLKTLDFYFADISAINSLGVRAWVTFLKGVEIGRDVCFHECVPDIVMQLNMIQSFQSSAKVASFFVSYFSPVTEISQKVLLKTENFPAKTIPTPPNCPESGVPMETEELEDEYFAFLLRP